MTETGCLIFLNFFSILSRWPAKHLSFLYYNFLSVGGQLRYQLYIWLEKEVEALRELCNYSSSDPTDPSDLESETNEQSTGMELSQKPSLHELLVQEKLDFEAKVQRAAKRKRWLRGKNMKIFECANGIL